MCKYNISDQQDHPLLTKCPISQNPYSSSNWQPPQVFPDLIIFVQIVISPKHYSFAGEGLTQIGQSEIWRSLRVVSSQVALGLVTRLKCHLYGVWKAPLDTAALREPSQASSSSRGRGPSGKLLPLFSFRRCGILEGSLCCSPLTTKAAFKDFWGLKKTLGHWLPPHIWF